MASGHKLPPFFVLPYDAPSPLWTELSLEERTPWYAWANSQPVGWLDHKTMIRPPEDAYTFVRTADGIPNGGVTTLTSPPAPQVMQPPVLARGMMSSTVFDSIVFQSSAVVTLPTTLMVWATAPAVAPNGIRVQQNKFIGSFLLVPGQPVGSVLADIGASYVAQFGSLIAEFQSFIQFWWWQSQQGQLQYGGTWRNRVNLTSLAGLAYYWPLNEAFGERRSSMQPAGLIPSGPIIQVAGSLDFAASASSNAGSQLTTYNAPETDFVGQSWTFIARLLIPSTYGLTTIYIKNKDSTQVGWTALFHILNTFQCLECEVTVGGANVTLDDRTAGALPVGTWLQVGVTYDSSTGTLSLYRNNVQTATAVVGMLDGGFGGAVGILGTQAGGAGYDNAMSDASYWNRVLSDPEIFVQSIAGLPAARPPFPA